MSSACDMLTLHASRELQNSAAASSTAPASAQRSCLQCTAAVASTTAAREHPMATHSLHTFQHTAAWVEAVHITGNACPSGTSCAEVAQCWARLTGARRARRPARPAAVHARLRPARPALCGSAAPPLGAQPARPGRPAPDRARCAGPPARRPGLPAPVRRRQRACAPLQPQRTHAAAGLANGQGKRGARQRRTLASAATHASIAAAAKESRFGQSRLQRQSLCNSRSCSQRCCTGRPHAVGC